MKTVIYNGARIPAEIAQLGAGKDAAMRQLKVRCDICGTVYRLCDSDSAALCADCYDLAGLENHISDMAEDDPTRPRELAKLATAEANQAARIEATT